MSVAACGATSEKRGKLPGSAGLVLRLDPGTGALLGAVHTGREPRESVEAGGALWVANQLNGTVTPVPLG